MSRQEAQYQKTSTNLRFLEVFYIELLLFTSFFHPKNNKTSITFAIIFSHRFFFEFRWIWEPFRDPNPFKIEEKSIQIIVSFSTSVLVDISSILEPKMAPRWRQDAAKMSPRCLQDAASKPTLLQEASKTPPDFDFLRFLTLPSSIFLDF